jgi:hypothetical protein
VTSAEVIVGTHRQPVGTAEPTTIHPLAQLPGLVARIAPDRPRLEDNLASPYGPGPGSIRNCPRRGVTSADAIFGTRRVRRAAWRNGPEQPRHRAPGRLNQTAAVKAYPG